MHSFFPLLVSLSDVAFVDFIPFLYHKLPNPNLRQESQKCTHCAFTTNVEERMLLHTGRHHLVCTECDQEFETKKELELHEQRFHTVEDVILYGCSLCNKSDQDKQRLCQHLSEHLQPQFGGGWLCHICLIKFASCETMKQHLQDRHILYKCTFCKQLSNEFESLERFVCLSVCCTTVALLLLNGGLVSFGRIS